MIIVKSPYLLNSQFEETNCCANENFFVIFRIIFASAAHQQKRWGAKLFQRCKPHHRRRLKKNFMEKSDISPMISIDL
jgi:hypothetical protein